MIADLGYTDERQTLAELYHNALVALLNQHEPGRYIDKGTTAEILGAHFILRDPTQNLIATVGRRFNYRYMIAEMLWNISGICDLEPLEKVFPGVRTFVQDQPKGCQHFATWAYGPEMCSGLAKCLSELRSSPTSRRAIITLAQPRMGRTYIQGTPPCLDSVQWFIRDGHLIQITRMRSNDVWRGFPLDVYQFSMWQLMMASALGLKVGPYHHFANSFHLYERDVEAARTLLAANDMQPVKSTTPGPSAAIHAISHEVGLSMRDWGRPLEVAGLDFGWKPWLETYKATRTLKEFAQLHDMGYGVGW